MRARRSGQLSATVKIDPIDRGIAKDDPSAVNKIVGLELTSQSGVVFILHPVLCTFDSGGTALCNEITIQQDDAPPATSWHPLYCDCSCGCPTISDVNPGDGEVIVKLGTLP
jgi:hypothetical protein